MNCICCNREIMEPASAHSFETLEVRTLHLREFGGERRIQALGDFQTFAVCESCGKTRRERTRKGLAGEWKKAAVFLLLLLAGIPVCVFGHSDRVFLLVGGAAAVCGIAGLFSLVKKTRDEKRALEKLSDEEALFSSAWRVVLDCAPKKDEEGSDLSYIPVTAETRSRKNGDLMILYDLLPEIAVEAYDKIHGR